MNADFYTQPILNSPYHYPKQHWELDKNGQPTQRTIEKRRPAKFITPIPKPKTDLEMLLRSKNFQRLNVCKVYALPSLPKRIVVLHGEPTFRRTS